MCTKLRQIANVLKIQAGKVEEFIREAIVDGITTGTEIYAKVVEFMKKEVLSKTCVDFLAPRVRYLSFLALVFTSGLNILQLLFKTI